MPVNSALIDQVRSASRTLVREWGFMESTLADTNLSPSAVHALLEIGKEGAMTAAQLVQVLKLEKSSISRMVSKLVEAGEICETPSAEDGRAKQLLLSPRGRQTVADVDQFARQQVISALGSLGPQQQQQVADGLAIYAEALKPGRTLPAAQPASAIGIVEGYLPGVIASVTGMHADYYSKHWGFGQFFESKVAAGLAEFMGRHDHPQNRIWLATLHGQIVGSVAIDGEDLGNNEAHLRWFILDDRCRGQGVGRKLMELAVAFADQRGFAATRLWTFKGLDTARKLYEVSGFELSWEQEGTQWGSKITEQQFTRKAG